MLENYWHRYVLWILPQRFISSGKSCNSFTKVDFMLVTRVGPIWYLMPFLFFCTNEPTMKEEGPCVGLCWTFVTGLGNWAEQLPWTTCPYEGSAGAMSLRSAQVNESYKHWVRFKCKTNQGRFVPAKLLHFAAWFDCWIYTFQNMHEYVHRSETVKRTIS